MKSIILFILVITLGCSRPLYIKDKHFDCPEKKYEMDSDLKKLIFKSLKRAVVIQKDIPDYRYIWKKDRIYIVNEYQSTKTKFSSQDDWDKNVSYLQSNDIPNEINNVEFCLKSREELQKISNQTCEDFLHISYSLIKIEDNKAIININNTWIVSKHSNKVYLGGGGYSIIYKKERGIWKFDKISSRWIS